LIIDLLKILGDHLFKCRASEYSYPDTPSAPAGETSSFNNYGFGFEVTKRISKVLSTSGGYDYSYVDRDVDNFSRHVLRIQLFGRF